MLHFEIPVRLVSERYTRTERFFYQITLLTLILLLLLVDGVNYGTYF